MSDGASRGLSTFNLIAAACLTALGLFALLHLIPNHIPDAVYFEGGLSARFMPTLTASVVTGLSIVLGANVLLRRWRGQEEMAEDNEDNEFQGFGPRELGSAAMLLTGSAVYVLLLQALGFVVATAIALAFCLYLGKVRNPIALGLVSIGLPYVLNEILWRGLMIIMPPFPFSL